MKGLLMKDLLIIKNQYKTLLVIVVMGIMMSLTFEAQTLISYIGMLGCMLALGTVAYDEIDNGYAFLFSMPINRKTYVKEKYLFIIGANALSLVFATILCFIISLTGIYEGQDIFKGLPELIISMLALMTIICDITVPLRIKYGSEKSRIFLYILMALFGVLFFVLSKVSPTMPESLMSFVTGINTPIWMIILVLVTVIITYISIRFCEKVIISKQF